MSDTLSEQTLMALLAPRAADMSAEPGMAVPAVGRRIASLPSLDERIEMFARMVCGPDVTVTPEIRAVARDHILTAIAADLVGATTDLTSEDSASEYLTSESQHLNSFAVQFETAMPGVRESAGQSQFSAGFVRDLARLLSCAAASFSMLRLGMAAVPLVALLVAGSVLTQNWLDSGETPVQGSTANPPKVRGLEPQTLDTVAEQNLRHAVAAEEAAHGRSHPAVARKLVDLVSLLQADGRYAEAQALCERALIIQDQALGPNNPETLRTIKALATVYRAEGRAKEADEILTRANQL